jgi:hypothetical protein
LKPGPFRLRLAQARSDPASGKPAPPDGWDGRSGPTAGPQSRQGRSLIKERTLLSGRAGLAASPVQWVARETGLGGSSVARAWGTAAAAAHRRGDPGSRLVERPGRERTRRPASIRRRSARCATICAVHSDPLHKEDSYIPDSEAVFSPGRYLKKAIPCAQARACEHLWSSEEALTQKPRSWSCDVHCLVGSLMEG